MATQTNQMLEARAHMMSIFRAGCPVLAGLVVVGAVSETWLSRAIPMASFGFLVGSLYAVGNIGMLFWLLAPYFFYRERPLRVLGAALISLGVGAALMFLATQLGVLWALGMAVGIASPALLSVATLKSAKTPREPA